MIYLESGVNKKFKFATSVGVNLPDSSGWRSKESGKTMNKCKCGCGKDVTKTWAAGHATALMRINTAQERYWKRVDKSGGDDSCWIWNGHKRKGYGIFCTKWKQKGAHCLSYEWLVGKIPEGKQLDHLCRNRACVNPKHLEPVTRKENILRGLSPIAMQARQTHCWRGHPLSGDNLRRNKKNNRLCIECSKLRSKKYALLAELDKTK